MNCVTQHHVAPVLEWCSTPWWMWFDNGQQHRVCASSLNRSWQEPPLPCWTDADSRWHTDFFSVLHCCFLKTHCHEPHTHTHITDSNRKSPFLFASSLSLIAKTRCSSVKDNAIMRRCLPLDDTALPASVAYVYKESVEKLCHHLGCHHS